MLIEHIWIAQVENIFLQAVCYLGAQSSSRVLFVYASEVHWQKGACEEGDTLVYMLCSSAGETDARSPFNEAKALLSMAFILLICCANVDQLPVGIGMN